MDAKPVFEKILAGGMAPARWKLGLRALVRRFDARGIAPQGQKVEGNEPSRTPILPGTERRRGN